MTSVESQLRRVAELVATAEGAIARLDTDPATGWGILATERLEVIDLLEQVGHPLPQSATAQSDHGAQAADPAQAYDAAAAVAADVDPAARPTGQVVALVQALTNAAAAVRSLPRG
jgi:hypothetical protein